MRTLYNYGTAALSLRPLRWRVNRPPGPAYLAHSIVESDLFAVAYMIVRSGEPG
jgi:hypothetical protein